MRVSVIDAIAGMLGGIKLNRISDKEVKTALVNDYLYLRRIAKKAGEKADDYREKFRDDWKDEMNAVELYRKEGHPVIGHEAYLKAEQDAQEYLQGIFSEDVEVEIKSVPMDAFLDACGKEELSLEQIAFLEEQGIIGE